MPGLTRCEGREVLVVPDRPAQDPGRAQFGNDLGHHGPDPLPEPFVGHGGQFGIQGVEVELHHGAPGGRGPVPALVLQPVELADQRDPGRAGASPSPPAGPGPGAGRTTPEGSGTAGRSRGDRPGPGPRPAPGRWRRRPRSRPGRARRRARPRPGPPSRSAPARPGLPPPARPPGGRPGTGAEVDRTAPARLSSATHGSITAVAWSTVVTSRSKANGWEVK